MTSFKGSPIEDVYKNKSPWDYEPLPVIVSNFHAILYVLQPNLKTPPEAHKSFTNFHWHDGYVRMPYSSKNLFPSTDESGIVSRWELIQKTLLQDIESSRAFEAAINAYNSRLPKFHALHYLFEEVFDEDQTDYFFKQLLPQIINLALKLPDVIPGSIPLLKGDHCKSISLSQYQISCLLANAFLCTFSGRKSINQDYPSINFNSLFSASTIDSVMEKLKCIIHYFKRVLNTVPVGVVTFERQHINRSNLPRWDKVENNLGNTKVHITSKGTIEDDGLGMLQVDFANKFLGGGVLGHGCVQEEIRFVICPELIISRLFTEKLGNHESLIITGVERFSRYKGYGDTFTWEGDFVDQTPFDKYGRRKTTVAAIDATYFSKRCDQFNSSLIFRELNKAYTGFYSRAPGNLTPIATGNWGCGAFGGDVHLKFLLQLMACNASGRNLVYFTFGSDHLTEELYNMYMFIATNQITISQLWRLICKFTSAQLNSEQLFPFIQQAYFDCKKQPSIKEAFNDLEALTATNAAASAGAQKRSANSTDPNSNSQCSNVTPGTSGSNQTVDDPPTMDGETAVVAIDSLPNVSNLTCRNSQSEKRKRSSSETVVSTDIWSIISKIDGESSSGNITTTTTSTSSSEQRSSLGFLNCVDEFAAKQRSTAANKDKSAVGADHSEMDVDNESSDEVDVDQILHDLRNFNESRLESRQKMVKKKITDYFKKQ